MNQFALNLETEKRTQKCDVLDWLLTHGSLTRGEAFYELGVAELSSRIGEIESDGWNVPRERAIVRARNGRKTAVTKYLRPYRRTVDGTSQA